MKKIYIITIVILFLMTMNSGFAQDCLDETRIDDPETNKQAVKGLKFYCKDNTVQYKISMFGNDNVKGEYLRHSFIKDWKYGTTTNGTPIRTTFVIVIVKTEKGCAQTILDVQQLSLGGDTFGNMSFFSAYMQIEGYSGYLKAKVDCDCVLKTKDWSK